MFVPLLTLGILLAIFVLAAVWTLADWAAELKIPTAADRKEEGPAP